MMCDKNKIEARSHKWQNYKGLDIDRSYIKVNHKQNTIRNAKNAEVINWMGGVLQA